MPGVQQETSMRKLIAFVFAIMLIASGVTHAQRYATSDGRLRVKALFAA
jgi:hypothetical protein